MIEQATQIQALQRSEFKPAILQVKKTIPKLHELHSKDCTKCGKKMVNGECVDCNKVPTL